MLEANLKDKKNGFLSDRDQRDFGSTGIAEETDTFVVLNRAVKRLQEQKQEVSERVQQIREELGDAGDLCRELRRDMALCKERIRELES